MHRNHRATILAQEKIQREAEEREQQLAEEMEERREQSHSMLAEELKRENEKGNYNQSSDDIWTLKYLLLSY
jgi:hypothetical protein